MTWLKKHHDLLLIILFFIFSFVVLVNSSLGPIVSNDGFWHLKMGLDLIEKGLSPFIDHYSFTHHGESISNVPVLFQVTLATFVSKFGLLEGYQYTRIFAASLLLLSLYYYFRFIKSPWYIIAIVLPFLLMFIQIRLF